MTAERIVYLPLGGAGEIGMNAYVYGYGAEGKERYILVDLGVAFPDMDGTPGVDLILPDISWLKERRGQLEAVFITHGHEDHIGAVSHYYEALGVPVYARAFTAHLTRLKLEDKGYEGNGVRTVSPWPEITQAGPFRVGFLPMAHSIPESSALVIDTPGGRVVHTGDFKLDETPVVGEPFSPAAWEEVAAGGVQALVCDSTNVFSPHEGRSERELGQPIEELIGAARGMVVATTFASNVARLKTLAEAGVRAGRSVCLMGRAMRRMIEAAITTGVLQDFPKTIAPEDARAVPRENLMILATGSQGERRAASAQLARGKFLGISLKEGDTFLFSSKTIPGNERGVIRIMNQFSEMGVDVIDDSSGAYHVSGHANRPDLARLHKIVKPTMVIPMHGEHRHLRAHAALAGENGCTSAIAPNGTMLSLSGKRPEVIEHIEAGRTYLDGKMLIGAFDGIVRDRVRMALNGHVTVTVLLDEQDEPLGDPWCDLMGLPRTGRSNAPLADVLEADLGQYLNRAGPAILSDEDKLERELKRIVRQVSQDEIGKKPEITLVVSRMVA